jgi:hypothetical protein
MARPLAKATALLLATFAASSAQALSVSIRFEVTSPTASHAARKLGDALRERGYEVRLAHPDPKGFVVRLALRPKDLPAEAFTFTPSPSALAIEGGDARGLIYGALAAVEELRNGTRLEDVRARLETPRLEFRAIKFNTPWDTYRPSSALDQHEGTVRDLRFWEAFLDMMVENRFNAISLWTLHPFTYLIRPRNFPEASPWTAEQLADWQRLYRGIFRLAKERGLDTYVVHWSIFVSEPFAKAHGVAKQNFYPHYYVPGDTSEVVKRYLRESVTQTLEEYPDLDGFGVSHGEGMADMTPLQRQQWIDEVLIAGMLAAKRPVKLIHRVPFSSGTSSAPGVSRSVEEVTRAAIERLGSRFSGPIWVEMKFNWSHALSTPKLLKVHGGKLGDTYFAPPPANYKVTWMARNEDVFALRWGVPDFIREHVAHNAQAPYVGGYFVGSETYIPALDYFTAATEPVRWRWAFERQWLFYKLWGRLLYDPQTPDAVFEAEFVRRYGETARPLLRAYALASATQLRLASLYDSRWDFTLYGEGFLALQGDYTRYISVDQLIRQPVLDPDYVSVADYVAAARSGSGFGADRVTPPVLAGRLERDSREALALVAGIDASRDASLRYEVADVQAWASLGQHLAEKLRGAVALEGFRKGGGEEQRARALAHLERALAHWDEVVRITRPLYRDMKLTHYNHNFFVANDRNLFHWALVRDEVAADLDVARAARPDSSEPR